MPDDEKSHRHSHLPRYVKIIIMAQAATILSFTVGMYQEYLSNTYLQQYVIGLFTSNIIPDALLSIVTASVFALGTFTLIGSVSASKKERREWATLTESDHGSLEMPIMPVLEVAQPSPASKKMNRRPRQRRPRIDNDDVYRSMTKYATERED